MDIDQEELLEDLLSGNNVLNCSLDDFDDLLDVMEAEVGIAILATPLCI